MFLLSPFSLERDTFQKKPGVLARNHLASGPLSSLSFQRTIYISILHFMFCDLVIDSMLLEPRVLLVWICGFHEVLSLLLTTQADQTKEKEKKGGGSIAGEVHSHLFHQPRKVGQKPMHEIPSARHTGRGQSCESGEITQASFAKNAYCSQL